MQLPEYVFQERCFEIFGKSYRKTPVRRHVTKGEGEGEEGLPLPDLISSVCPKQKLAVFDAMH